MIFPDGRNILNKGYLIYYYQKVIQSFEKLTHQ